MEFVLDGYCGLYCGACPVLLKTRAGDEPAPCYGCKSNYISQHHCATCDIKACARQKGYAFCHECAELNTCERMHTFMAAPEWPYHQSVLKNLECVERDGLQPWLEEQAKRWRCPQCGAAHSWWDETCRQCGAAVSSYRADL